MDSSAKYGIGIVGYGGFGEFIRGAWDVMENAHVVAVCDADPNRAPGEDVHFYDHVEDILADDNVDILSIATPPNSHKDIAIAAMRAGKHVLIEKPLALTEADAREIQRVAEETGRIATVDFVLRFNPLAELLHDIIENEILGKLRRVDLRNYAMQETVPEGHWFWKPDVSGRILLEHGVHFFDLASWVIGSPAKNVFGMGVERKPGMEDRVFAAVEYENGVVGTFWHSFSRPRELETTTFHFAFDLGEIDMGGWIPLELAIWGWTSAENLELLRELAGNDEIEGVKIGPMTTKSSEFDYEVDYEIDTIIELDEPKLNVYAENLRAIMADLIEAIGDPSHEMRVTLEDAIEAVRTAEMGTK